MRATDSGNPRRTTTVSVTILITRAVLPKFINQPYSITIDEGRSNASQIYRVTATDDDGQVLLGCFLRFNFRTRPPGKLNNFIQGSLVQSSCKCYFSITIYLMY